MRMIKSMEEKYLFSSMDMVEKVSVFFHGHG